MQINSIGAYRYNSAQYGNYNNRNNKQNNQKNDINFQGTVLKVRTKEEGYEVPIRHIYGDGEKNGATYETKEFVRTGFRAKLEDEIGNKTEGPGSKSEFLSRSIIDEIVRSEYYDPECKIEFTEFFGGEPDNEKKNGKGSRFYYVYVAEPRELVHLRELDMEEGKHSGYDCEAIRTRPDVIVYPKTAIKGAPYMSAEEEEESDISNRLKVWAEHMSRLFTEI